MIRILFLTLALLGLNACGPERRTVQIQGQTMGTSYHIKAVLAKGVEPDPIQKEIDQLLLDFDHDMSNWNPKSWVNAFNDSNSTLWQDAPPHAMAVLELAQRISKASGGAFDITLSPLIERWGFGAREKSGFPTQSEIKGIQSHMGYLSLELHPERSQVRKTIPQLKINASAIAKGYGVDLVAELLMSKGIEHYMVEIGGEVRCGGKPMQRDTWSLGLQKPVRDSGLELHGTVPLLNQSMATSGDYRNFFMHEGKAYSHVIDPITGSPVNHGLCSVTITANSCALADALATACLVLGEKRSLEWVQSFPGCDIYMIIREKEGHFRWSSSEGFTLVAL